MYIITTDMTCVPTASMLIGTTEKPSDLIDID